MISRYYPNHMQGDIRFITLQIPLMSKILQYIYTYVAIYLLPALRVIVSPGGVEDILLGEQVYVPV